MDKQRDLFDKILVITILFLFVFIVISPSVAFHSENKSSFLLFNRNILYVGGNGSGNYTTIQNAIDNASNGDTVFVFNGTYIGHINVNKSINVIGQDKNITFIMGFIAYTLSIISDWVNFSGFTIQNDWRLGEGVRIDSCNNNFFDNIIDTPNDNIRVFGDNNSIFNNTIIGNSIYLSGNNNSIFDNSITNKDYGIYSTDSCDNIISNNSFFNSGLFISYKTVSNIIVTNNTVNNKTLICLYNKLDLVLDFDAGQIILINCTNVTIENQEIYNATVGIQILGSSNCVISGNTIVGNRYGVYLYGRNNKINGNIITNNSEGICFFDDNNTVFCNTISNNDDGIYFYYSRYNNIINNTFENNYYGMLLDYGSNYNNIIKNNITNNYDGISISGSHNTIISENIITNNEHYGIDVYGDSNTISNNSIQNNTYGGILIYHSNNNVVSGNTISNNIYDGIELTGDINTIIDNNITNNNDDGIYLWGLCYYNNIINNNISNNRCNGIQLSGKKNTISGNTIAKNKNYGINIDYKTDNNTIYYNNFIENFENAYDECENIWDDGKKGNYWNDYKEKYPNAHKLWLKGIWNTPYAITGGENKDNFPLIKQINTPRNRISDISFKIFLKHNIYIFQILQKILNIIYN